MNDRIEIKPFVCKFPFRHSTLCTVWCFSWGLCDVCAQSAIRCIRAALVGHVPYGKGRARARRAERQESRVRTSSRYNYIPICFACIVWYWTWQNLPQTEPPNLFVYLVRGVFRTCKVLYVKHGSGLNGFLLFAVLLARLITYQFDFLHEHTTNRVYQANLEAIGDVTNAALKSQKFTPDETLLAVPPNNNIIQDL